MSTPTAPQAGGPGKGTPEPFTLVIFGASGDLTRRKLIPAVYSLFRGGLLPERFAVVGFARRAKTDDGFRDEMRRGVEAFSRTRLCDDACWRRFAARLHYHVGDYDDPAAFEALRERLDAIAAGHGAPRNCLFYLATPPAVFHSVVERLRQAKLAQPPGAGAPLARVII